MKIKVKNDWEYLTYTFDRKVVDEKKDGEVILTNGERVKYKSVKGSASYSDWGRVYSTPQYKLIAKIPFNNQMIDVDLTQLDIKEVL